MTVRDILGKEGFIQDFMIVLKLSTKRELGLLICEKFCDNIREELLTYMGYQITESNSL